MRRVMLTLAMLAVLGLVTSAALAGPPSHKNTKAQISLAAHHGHGHHGHHGHHHGHPHWYHRGPGVVVVPAPVYRPTVVVPAVPAYPQYYYYDPRPSGSIGVYGRKFGFSIGF
jgi:hypothetical protein